MPTLQPFWAAGFAFSRGHFVLRVPYDPYLPMLFQVPLDAEGAANTCFCAHQPCRPPLAKYMSVLQGEEISMGVRAFTHGYDFYAPMYVYASRLRLLSVVCGPRFDPSRGGVVWAGVRWCFTSTPTPPPDVPA